jgi:hypothetical protein
LSDSEKKLPRRRLHGICILWLSAEREAAGQLGLRRASAFIGEGTFGSGFEVAARTARETLKVIGVSIREIAALFTFVIPAKAGIHIILSARAALPCCAYSGDPGFRRDDGVKVSAKGSLVSFITGGG